MKNCPLTVGFLSGWWGQAWAVARGMARRIAGRIARRAAWVVAGLGLWGAQLSGLRAEGSKEAATPATAEAAAAAAASADLRGREAKVQALVQRVMPCVVAVTSADGDKPGSGSGVIISKEGLILTAAHVTQATGNQLTIIFPDGRRVKGTSLGANRSTDSGMARIEEPGEWPCVEMGSSDLLQLGDWVVAMGHPGGYSSERRPPVRLGRVWRRDLDGALFTSCPLIGGDSGGPLFDLEGRVVGIHSSIHGSVEMNRHVAIDTLRFDWDKLIKDQTWGKVAFNSGGESRPITGARFDRESREGVRVLEVFAGLPAAQAGLQVGDVVERFDGERVATFFAMQRLIGRRKAGERVPLGVRRGEAMVDLQLELGRRPQLHRAGSDGPDGPGGEDERGPREPRVPEEAGPRPWLGAAVEASEAGPRLGTLVPQGPAAQAGLQEGDIVMKINGTAVKDASEVAEVFRGLGAAEKALFEVQRGGVLQTIEVKLGRPPLPSPP